jgi:hypothetical protein
MTYGIKKIHRRYPDNKWDYKAVSVMQVKDGKPRDVNYYKLKDNGKKSEGVEVYSGKNYVVGSNEVSHSNRYDIDKVPNNLKPIVYNLKSEHNKIKWSKKKYVDLN